MSEGYLNEILEQPAIIAGLPDRITPETYTDLDRVAQDLSSGRIHNIVFTGMGGSLHSMYGLWLHLSGSLQGPAALWDTSELVQQAPGLIRDHTLLIAVSQSGESIELRRLTELERRPGASICVTNGPSNTLANWSDIVIATHAGPEKTASTKTYTSGLAGLYLLGTALAGDDVAAATSGVRAAAEQTDSFLREQCALMDDVAGFLGAVDPIFFIARGSSISSARMGALLTQEAAKLTAVAYSGGQFRHGPLEMVRPGFVGILFDGNDHTSALNRKTAADIARLGGKCLVISPQEIAVKPAENARNLCLPTIESRLLPIVEILPVQLLMIPLARSRGFEPAAFLNASKVTTEE